MSSEASHLLSSIVAGDHSRTDRLMEVVYEDMRSLAGKYLRGDTDRVTLQPTALVHEAFIRLVGDEAADWRGKSHFLATGATAMRQILVDYARRRSAHKRGGGRVRVTFDETLVVSTRRDEDVLAVHEALEKLAQIDPARAQIVEMRFFGGLSNEDVAEVLGISRQAAHKNWSGARAWLRREMVGAQAQ